MAYKANLAYVYTRERKDFGRCCRFRVEGPMFMYNEPPHPVLREMHMRQKPRCIGTQISELWGLHHINTDMVPYKRRNENHVEGGWPKEINFQDTVTTARYVKKIERDDTIIQLLPQLYEKSYRWLVQNSALHIFDEYKDDGGGGFGNLGQPTCRKLNVYNDFSKQPARRPCVSITFSQDPKKFAATYNDMIFQKSRTTDTFAYIWYMDNPNNVDMVLDAGYPPCVLAYSPRHSWSIAGGLNTGQICHWDTRRGSRPVSISPYYDSFREPVTCVKWLHTKDSMNIFSGSTDGTIKWWDLRDLSEPIEYLIIDTDKTSEELSIQRSWGVSCIEYEPTISTKFMVGTTNGYVIAGIRKGKTMQEKINQVFNCGQGPVYNIERNPFYLKNFITVCDYSVKIWVEDFKEQSIMWSKPGYAQMVGVGWSPHRLSCFYVARKDGYIEAWDLMDMTEKPVLTFKATDYDLMTMTVHPSGTILAVGAGDGSVTLLEMSKHFVIPDKISKAVVGAMMDREARREKVLEGKIRELRLKAKGGLVEEAQKLEIGGEDDIKEAEEYFKTAIQEFETTGKISKYKVQADDYN